MNKDQSIEAKKHEMSVRSMYFSRYMMIRYFSAAYTFVNLFWLIFALCYKDILASVIALVMMVSIAMAIVEQLSKWHTKSTDMRYTKFFYVLQLVMNVIFAIACYTPVGKAIFPFMTTNDVANIIFTILLLGIGGCLIILKRISNIQSGRDRYLHAIKTFENNRQ
ncbi:ABC-type multidrug transport system permease subunit [Lactobacillus colini]|uniref:ABC-type multidrug transport system permease subunit n=1 Tax=Lactobacillus colini TaxID=1819254 RepID=A0ABS4MCF3_9LACO|nr:PTS cellobiose transporter subunit IIA [Lactobacillus colini]MBP2057363.1 ABC-type multidrug transport system permease subunit [Lactobacillus colini]